MASGSPQSRVVGSILHGAYGDYYEQAICLKHFKREHPDVRLKLFAASQSRLRELSVLDLSFAESFTHWSNVPDCDTDEFLQFQVTDPALCKEVLAHLPSHVVTKIKAGGKRLPWIYLREILPLQAADQLGLNSTGRERLCDVMHKNGISESTFERLTVGFLWRYRGSRSAVRPWMQPPSEKLVGKYSAVLKSMINRFDCNVLICGMKVETTPDNRERTDCKYPRFGLDLPTDHAKHLKGLGWALELEILSRCDICLVHASGFSEALFIRRAKDVLMTDPPLHYKLKLLKHRMPLFGHDTAAGFNHIWFRHHSEEYLTGILSAMLNSESHPGVRNPAFKAG